MDGYAMSMARSDRTLRSDLPMEIPAISVLAMAAIRPGTAEHSCDSGDKLFHQSSDSATWAGSVTHHQGPDSPYVRCGWIVIGFAIGLIPRGLMVRRRFGKVRGDPDPDLSRWRRPWRGAFPRV
jgi:hypothetical protein